MEQMDVNTGIHQLPSECYPPTDSDDDSFVVLKVDPESNDESEPDLPKMLPSSVIDESLEMATDVLAKPSMNFENIPPPLDMLQISTNMESSSVSSLISLSSDEIHKKVNLLIEENNKLKEILLQNNLAMKNQYKMLMKWQQDVEKVQESHKNKFIKTKAYIKELQQENEMLKQNSTSFLQVDMSGKIASEFEERINNLKLENHKLIDASLVEKSKLIARNLEQERDIQNFKKAYEENIKLSAILKQNVDIRENRISELEETINNLKLANQVSIKVKNQKDELMSQIKEQKMEIENLKKFCEDMERTNDIKEQKYLEEITTLKVVVEQLKSKEVEAEEMENLKQQLRAAQAYITEVKQTKKAVETEAAANRQRIDDLNGELSKLKIDNDRSLALEAQLDIYKQDVEVQKSSKLKILKDKNRIAEDLQNIQGRNQELLEELERLRSLSSFVEVGSASAPRAEAARPPSPQISTYNCFICGKNLRSLPALQEHVDYCLINNT